MKKVIWVLGITVCLVLGTMLVSCAPAEEPDVWSDVTSIDQLIGTWRLALSEQIDFKEFMFLQYPYSGNESQREEFNTLWNGPGYATFFGNINIDFNRTEITTIDASVPSGTTSGTLTIVFSGGNINTPSVWNSVILLLFNEIMPQGSIVNDTNKSFTYTAMSSPNSNILGFYDYYREGMKINQNGRKIKLTNPGSTTPSNPLSPQELIYIKQ